MLGITSHDLGDALGRDRTVVSRILNGRQRMTLTHAKVFAELLDSSIDEVLERAGELEPSEAQPLRPGFSESDAAVWIPKRETDPSLAIAAALGVDQPGVDIWQVKSSAMALQGYLPGDLMLVDSHLSERCNPGDVVIAQIYNWNSGEATTILRRFEPPVLIAASTGATERRVHVVDGNNVVIKGKVIASWRA